MREAFHEQLDSIFVDLAAICGRVKDAVHLATEALLTGDSETAERVISADVEIDLARERIEDMAFSLLSLQQPVAGDLRTVVCAIRASGDLERMDVLARHVAEAALRRQSRCAVPEQVRPAFTEMNRLGVEMALKAAEVARTRNVLLAVELDADDEAMDDLHAQLFGVLMDRSWPHGIAAAVDVTLLGRYYERFADHAVLVADETVTAVTGRRRREVAEFLRAQRSATG